MTVIAMTVGIVWVGAMIAVVAGAYLWATRNDGEG